MKLYLNAGNGGRPMGDRAVQFIKDHLFDGVRIGIPIGLPEEMIEPVVRELADADLEACLIAGGWDWWTGDKAESKRDVGPTAEETLRDAIMASLAAQRAGLRFYIEPGNEPNLAPAKFKTDPAGFGKYVNDIAVGLIASGGLNRVRVISGGVSNINPWEGLPYVQRVSETLASVAILGVHPYRMGNRPKEALGDQPIGLIADLIRDLHPRFAITEGGWHTAPRRAKRGFPLCFTYQEVPGWTDDEVATFAREEMDIWEKRAPEFYTWYQLGDGPNNEQEHRFGVQTIDGTPKPVAAALKEWQKRRGR
ncbi:MAG: hypothetical protein ACREIS_06375 [Nitrospiraceae bacterium]